MKPDFQQDDSISETPAVSQCFLDVMVLGRHRQVGQNTRVVVRCCRVSVGDTVTRYTKEYQFHRLYFII